MISKTMALDDFANWGSSFRETITAFQRSTTLKKKKILFNIDCSIIIPQAEGETTVLVAGDPERAHIQKVKEDGGIHYHVNLLEAMVC